MSRKNILILILAILFFAIWLSMAQKYYYCVILEQCAPPPPPVDSSQLAHIPNDLRVSAEGFPLWENYPEFEFDYGSTAPLYLPKQLALLEEMALLLKSQPQAKLKIIGRYKKEETLPEQAKRYGNLGRARALSIADKLMAEYQLPSQQIYILGDTMPLDKKAFYIDLEIIGYLPSGPEQEKKEAERFRQAYLQDIKRLTYDGRMAFFRSPDQRFKLAPPVFGDYLDSLQNYLAQNPKAQLIIIGHTDSKLQGQAAQEEALSFALQTKAYLEHKGINCPIQTQSRSNQELLQIDTLADGSRALYKAAQNRRVEILVEEVP